MKDEEELKQQLADLGGNVFTTGGAQGVVKIRRETKKRLLIDILELGDNQMLCTECLTVQDADETWDMPKPCPDCSEQVQTRLGDQEAHP